MRIVASEPLDRRLGEHDVPDHVAVVVGDEREVRHVPCRRAQQLDERHHARVVCECGIDDGRNRSVVAQRFGSNLRR
jgi:hypothetical protein